jgi:hypothetical protein
MIHTRTKQEENYYLGFTVLFVFCGGGGGLNRLRPMTGHVSEHTVCSYVCWRGMEKVGWTDRVRDEEVLES